MLVEKSKMMIKKVLFMALFIDSNFNNQFILRDMSLSQEWTFQSALRQ